MAANRNLIVLIDIISLSKDGKLIETLQEWGVLVKELKCPDIKRKTCV